MDRLNAIIGSVNAFAWGPPMLGMLGVTGVLLTLGLVFIAVAPGRLRLPVAVRQERSRRRWRGQALQRPDDGAVGDGGNRKHRRRRHGHRAGRSGRDLLHVAHRAVRHGHQVRRGRVRGHLPRGGRQRPSRRRAPCTTCATAWASSLPSWASGWGWGSPLFGAVAAFGIGNAVQVNSMATALVDSFGVPTWLTGIIVAVLVGIVVIGGIQRIGEVAGKLVPAMIVLYIGAALLIIFINITAVPAAIALIFTHAFTPAAAAGGFAGAAVAAAVRFGVARGRVLQRVRAGVGGHRPRGGADQQPGAAGHHRHAGNVHRHK